MKVKWTQAQEKGTKLQRNKMQSLNPQANEETRAGRKRSSPNVVPQTLTKKKTVEHAIAREKARTLIYVVPHDIFTLNPVELDAVFLDATKVILHDISRVLKSCYTEFPATALRSLYIHAQTRGRGGWFYLTFYAHLRLMFIFVLVLGSMIRH